MAWPGNIDHVEILLLDDTVQMHVDEVQPRRRPPVTEQPRLNVGALKRLLEQGIVKNPLAGIKILGNGEISVSLTVKASKFSQSAVEKIQAAGGKTEVI